MHFPETFWDGVNKDTDKSFTADFQRAMAAAAPDTESEKSKAIKQHLGIRMNYQGPKLRKGMAEWIKAAKNIDRKEA